MTDTSGTTGAGKLWGGRFAGGPSPELEALSRSTHFDWRLAGYDLDGSRAHARVLHGAGLLTDDGARRSAGGARRARPAGRAGELLPQESDEDVHGALEGALVELVGRRPRWQAPRRAQPQRPDRHAVQGVPARPRPHHRRAGPRPRRRDRRPGRAPPRRDHAGPHAPPARAAGAAQPPPDGPRLAAGPRRVPAPRLGRQGRGRLAVRLRVRWPAPASASTPRRWPATSASPAAPPTRSTARRAATSSPSSPSSPR